MSVIVGPETGLSVPNPPTAKAARSRVLYALLFIYAGIAGTYEVVNSISTTIGNFNLRNQVQAPFQLYGNLVYSSTAAATRAGLAKGDTILAINQSPFTDQALWQRIRWRARPGDTIAVVARKQNGTTLTATIPLVGYPKGWSVEDLPIQTTLPGKIFVLMMVIVVPLFCLVLGVWVAFARPFDPNAWFIPCSSDLSASVQSRGVSLVDSGLAKPSTLLAPRHRLFSARRNISFGLTLSGTIALG